MKSVKFVPLRTIKKTGKICVLSYMGWRKIKTSDYNVFNLIIDSKYKTFPTNQFVYNHKGELLFWYKLLPEDLSFFDSDEIVDFDEKIDYIKLVHDTQKNFAWKHESGDYYICSGLDCDGVPTFSHYTADYIARIELNPNDFEPLTVGVVRKWLGWFLWTLKNSKLEIQK